MTAPARRWLAALAVAGTLACRSAPEPAGRSAHLAALSLVPVGSSPGGPLDLAGRVVFVSFFATWCFPCLAEIPLLQKLQEEFGPKGLTVVGVGMDLEGALVLGPFVEHYALGYPVIVADERLRSEASPFGSVSVLPTAFLLDREGRLRSRWQGVVSHDEVRELVRRSVEH